MLQISTKQNVKLVEVDGFAFKIRNPGAGESLTMQKSGRELTKLGKVKEPSAAETSQLEDLTIELLGICLGLFDSDDPKAKEYIQTLPVEVLLDVVNQVFNPNEPIADTAEAS